MDLVEAILDQGATGQPLRLVDGKVTQASPLLVQVNGAATSTSCPKLASYSPTLNDKVQVLVQGANRLVLGKVG